MSRDDEAETIYQVDQVDPAERRLSVGDYVYCRHAQADGVVSAVTRHDVSVRVTATYSANYVVGREYAWMPMQLTSIAASELN